VKIRNGTFVERNFLSFESSNISINILFYPSHKHTSKNCILILVIYFFVFLTCVEQNIKLSIWCIVAQVKTVSLILSLIFLFFTYIFEKNKVIIVVFFVLENTECMQFFCFLFFNIAKMRYESDHVVVYSVPNLTIFFCFFFPYDAKIVIKSRSVYITGCMSRKECTKGCVRSLIKDSSNV